MAFLKKPLQTFNVMDTSFQLFNFVVVCKRKSTCRYKSPLFLIYPLDGSVSPFRKNIPVWFFALSKR